MEQLYLLYRCTESYCCKPFRGVFDLLPVYSCRVGGGACTHSCTRTHAHTHKCACTHTNSHAHTHMSMHTDKCACTHAHLLMHKYACTDAHMCARTYADKFTSFVVNDLRYLCEIFFIKFVNTTFNATYLMLLTSNVNRYPRINNIILLQIKHQQKLNY